MKKALSNSISMSLALTFPTFSLRAAPCYQRLAKVDGLSLKPLPKSFDLGKGGTLHAMAWTLFSNKRFNLDFAPLSHKLCLLAGKAKILESLSLGFHIANHLQKEIWVTLPKLRGFQSTFHISPNSWAWKVDFREPGKNTASLLACTLVLGANSMVDGSESAAKSSGDSEKVNSVEDADEPQGAPEGQPVPALPQADNTQKPVEAVESINGINNDTDDVELLPFPFLEGIKEKTASQRIAALQATQHIQAMEKVVEQIAYEKGTLRLHIFGEELLVAMQVLVDVVINYKGAYCTKQEQNTIKISALLFMIEPEIKMRLKKLEQKPGDSQSAAQLRDWFKESIETILQFQSLELLNPEKKVYENTYPHSASTRLQEGLDFFVATMLSPRPTKEILFEKLTEALHQGDGFHRSAFFSWLHDELLLTCSTLDRLSFKKCKALMSSKLQQHQLKTLEYFRMFNQEDELLERQGICVRQRASLEEIQKSRDSINTNPHNLLLESTGKAPALTSSSLLKALENIKNETEIMEANFDTFRKNRRPALLNEEGQSQIEGSSIQKKSLSRTLGNGRRRSLSQKL